MILELYKTFLLFLLVLLFPCLAIGQSIQSGSSSSLICDAITCQYCTESCEYGSCVTTEKTLCSDGRCLEDEEDCDCEDMPKMSRM